MKLFGWKLIRLSAIEKQKSMLAHEVSTKVKFILKADELQTQCENYLEVQKIYVDHINDLQNKIANLEIDCKDYADGQIRYEEIISNLRNKATKGKRKNDN